MPNSILKKTGRQNTVYIYTLNDKQLKNFANLLLFIFFREKKLSWISLCRIFRGNNFGQIRENHESFFPRKFLPLKYIFYQISMRIENLLFSLFKKASGDGFRGQFFLLQQRKTCKGMRSFPPWTCFDLFFQCGGVPTGSVTQGLSAKFCYRSLNFILSVG